MGLTVVIETLSLIIYSGPISLIGLHTQVLWMVSAETDIGEVPEEIMQVSRILEKWILS